MSYLKTWVMTLSATLIFISTVELILPKNNMRKYVKFVLGLILMAVILNPITIFLSKGEKEFLSVISEYGDKIEAGNFKYEKVDSKSSEIFNQKLEYSCNKVLKDKFQKMEFETFVDAKLDEEDVSVDFKEIKVKYFEKGINKIQKVSIELDRDKTSSLNEDPKVKEIKSFLAKELKVSENIIKVEKGS